MIDEGYTKFSADWIESAALTCPQIAELNAWRRPLFDAGLVGYYHDSGIGFGNISRRVDLCRFVISGTQTGHLPDLGGQHYALVTDVDIDQNRISCRGPVQASSESMTHAMLYALDASINSVIHVHSDALWTRLKNQIATTAAGVAYGTPDMAREFARLYRDTEFRRDGIAVMAGHHAGLVSTGSTVEEAATRVLVLLD